MIIGERNHSHPTVLVPPWSYGDHPTDHMHFTFSPSSNANSSPSFSTCSKDYSMFSIDWDVDFPVDGYSCDHFHMYEFKVRKCTRARSHDWTECPYAHPGEKARRRDPRKFHYSGTACADFRKGYCTKGDGCEFAHGVFECWLHPARYRTQPCKDGVNCKRRVCFFAHTPEQLRLLSPRADGKHFHFMPSPESGSPPCESPPMTTNTNSVSSIVDSLRQLQLSKVKSMPCSWNLQIGSPVLGSPRLPVNRPGFCSLPSTPTQIVNQPGGRYFDLFEEGMERVESGRDLRAKMFEKLSKDNPLDGNIVPNRDPVETDAPNPDVGWVSELIQ